MEINPLMMMKGLNYSVRNTRDKSENPEDVFIPGQNQNRNTEKQAFVKEKNIYEITNETGNSHFSDENTWNPAVQKNIDKFIDRVKSGEIKDPKAVFDADGTIWKDDIGERFFEWLIKNRKLNDVDYSKDIYKEYEDEVKKDPGVGYTMAVTMMKGIKEKDLINWSKEFFPEHFMQNIYPKQKELIKRLQDSGTDVWIVTASNRWIVEGAAPYMGVNPDHIVGIQTEVKNGELTGKIIPPVTYRAGKVEAIKKYISDHVDFAAGNSMTDFEMLDFSRVMSLVINPKNEGPDENNLMHLAEKNKWSIQKW